MVRAYTWIVLVMIASTAHSQPGFGVEMNAIDGRIIKHSAKFTSPIPAMSTEADINFIWQTYGKKDWQQRRHFPVLGVGITYTGYGNNQIYGRCIGVYPNMQIPIVRGQNWEWTFRFGDGLGYVTKKHTATSDTINPAVSTNLVDFAMFMTNVRYTCNEHWQLQAGVSFSHISNADYYQPNLGINMAGVSIGARYFPETCHPKYNIRNLPKLKNRWLAEARVSTSYKEARAAGNPILPTYIVAAYASRRWLSKNKFYIGADYAYHNDVHAFLKNYGIELNHDLSRFSWDGAIFIGNEFLVGKVGLITQLGVYYHQTWLKFDACYEKIGANYYLVKSEHGPVKELFLSGLLLTHEIVAQLAEFGIGVGI